MLRFISWSAFLTSLFTTVFAYWIAVLVIYYRRDIISFFKKSPLDNSATREVENTSTVDLFDRCNDCAFIIKSIIRQGALANCNKETLVSELKTSLRPFGEFKGTMWQTPINNLIQYESQRACSVNMEDGDLITLWDFI